ncbi:MAG TPA: uroporphyrinogen-III C-methyltransferase [Syntrophus sp. (in: bacteria)]|jgi:uroporphyrinogen III methyltransferase/synthase|nr:uroporphyrinogen-III C-methyltransferase [Syntrophus sp. (in: bacteria)]
MTERGKVYIIGAGPGDPGLITVKGAQGIARADVIIYDHLVSEELLSYARKDARLIYAGKKGGDHTLPQDEINRLLVAEAQAGHTVARLKGGDPFIFGRGGEEAETLAAAGIPFEIIPGVTAAVAVPAYAGIPLTHRGLTSTLAFVTGHEDPTKEKSDIDWQSLAGIGTLVFFMGVKNLPSIAARLIAHGKDPQTPAALIRWGTTADQETITGVLADIAGKAAAQGFTPPSLLVVGPVVSLRETLNWFENRPLFGRGVVITRPEAQAESFAALLQEQGARAIHFPTIKIVPPKTWTALDDALERLADYAWIVFTSANGVRFFFQRLQEQGRDVRELKNIRIGTIGPATAVILAAMGIKVDLVPEEYISEGVVAAFQGQDIRGARILLPRAEQARDVIPAGLEKMGAAVDVVTVYRTISSGRRPEELDKMIKDGKVDVITFTSPSTITNFQEIMGRDYTLPPQVKVAAIGPVTAAAVNKAGLKVDIMQETYTIEGLVAGLQDFFAG